MANQILVRDIPQPIRDWIDEERDTNRMTQNEFLLAVLESACESQYARQPSLFETPERSSNGDGDLPFTFIDLFAGIGGLRIPLEAAGGRCVFSSEIDRYAQKTYRAWFDETPDGDITKIPISRIPDHDFLAAGFPCQPFSLAGVSKKNSLGQLHGFSCKAQGTLFFNIASIIQIKRPPVVLLENVKNLRSHDSGRTWQVIKDTLENELEYNLFHKVIDAADYVPQHRERIYLACFDKNVFGENPPFTFPTKPTGARPKLEDILDPVVDPKYTLSDHLWNYLQEYARKHREKGNGFGYSLADRKGITRTLSARYHKDGSEILIPQGPERNPRRLTPKECLRLMGFPEDKKIVVSDTQAYRQFGNAVVPKVAEAVIGQMIAVMKWQLSQTKNGCLLKGKFKAANR